MTQEENEKLMYASVEDMEFYLKCVHGLPTLAGLNGSGKDENEIPLPFGLGSHSVRCLREICEIVKPHSILEIGFNMGWSASLWLEIAPQATLISCDISRKQATLVAARFLKEKYNARFVFIDRNSEFFDLFTQGNRFDLIFIDGAHELDGVIADIELALELKIHNIAFDDFLPDFGQVQEAIATFGDKLELVNVNGNIALYKNQTI